MIPEQAVMAAPPTRSGTFVLLPEMHADRTLEYVDPYQQFLEQAKALFAGPGDFAK